MSGLTLARIDQLAADIHNRIPTDPVELAALMSLARAGLDAERTKKPVPLLEQLIAKLPDFDLGWTPEQKLSWFDGMAKLIQAAS